jgi:hypothetical protein
MRTRGEEEKKKHFRDSRKILCVALGNQADNLRLCKFVPYKPMASEFPLIMSSARQKSAVALKSLRVAASASLPGYRVRSGILRAIQRPQSARYLATPGSDNSRKSSTGGQQQPLSLSVYNPFLNGTPKIKGMVGWFKLVLGLPIAVVRVALMVPLAAVCAPWGYLSLVGYKPGNNPSLPAPLRGWRAVLFFPCRLFARGVLFLLGFHWVKIKGQIAPATQAPLLLPNHLGFVVSLPLSTSHSLLLVVCLCLSLTVSLSLPLFSLTLSLTPSLSRAVPVASVYVCMYPSRRRCISFAASVLRRSQRPKSSDNPS